MDSSVTIFNMQPIVAIAFPAASQAFYEVPSIKWLPSFCCVLFIVTSRLQIRTKNRADSYLATAQPCDRPRAPRTYLFDADLSAKSGVVLGLITQPLISHRVIEFAHEVEETENSI